MFFSQAPTIDRRLVPNLRRLKITWQDRVVTLQALNQLFHRDVFFSLTHFSLIGRVANVHVIQQLLSTLSAQCSYSLDVMWYVETALARSDVSTILLDTFRRLKGRKTMELELTLYSNCYGMSAFT